jgi:hypothetical protein
MHSFALILSFSSLAFLDCAGEIFRSAHLMLWLASLSIAGLALYNEVR